MFSKLAILKIGVVCPISKKKLCCFKNISYTQKNDKVNISIDIWFWYIYLVTEQQLIFFLSGRFTIIGTNINYIDDWRNIYMLINIIALGNSIHH